MATSQILFLCTGNYYRSRFAEEYFNCRAPAVGADWRAFSRGLAVKSGKYVSSGNPGPISIHALEYLNLYRIEAQDIFRYPLCVTLQDLESADRIVALSEAEHKEMLIAMYPQYEHLVQYFAIEDIHIDKPAYALPRLVQDIDRLMSEMVERDANKTAADN